MRQSAFRYLGVLVIIVPIAMLAMYGVPESLVDTGLLVLLVIAGLLFIVSSTYAEIAVGGITLRWRQGIALGVVLVAITVPVPYLLELIGGHTSLTHIVSVIVVIGASVAMLFFAFDIVGGGRYFKLTGDVDRRIGGRGGL